MVALFSTFLSNRMPYANDKPFQFGDKYYVLIKTAAQYLHMSYDRLIGQVLLGKLEANKFGSRQFVELETLKAYAKEQGLSTEGWGEGDIFYNKH